MKGGEIMASQENEKAGNPYRDYDVLLSEASSKISWQELIPLEKTDGAHLVFGNFSERPMFALVEGDGVITPLPHAKDVLGLRAPLAAEVVSSLEELRERQGRRF